MAKLKTLQSSLNGGELSPKLKGRPELPRYQSGLERCENFVPFVLGGATVRPGSRFVAEGINVDTEHTLDVFTDLDDAGTFRGFCIESTASQMRIFKGTAPVQTLATDIFAATGPGVKKVDQNDSFFYIAMASKPPQRLAKRADNDWYIEAVPFKTLPFARPPKTEDITLTPSGVSGDITLTASADLFQAGHVNVKFNLNGGTVKITGVTNSTHATATVVNTIPTPTGVHTRTFSFHVTYDPPYAGDPAVYTGGPFNFTCSATADFTTDTITGSSPEVLPEGVTVIGSDSAALLTGTEADKGWKEEAWSDVRGWPVAVAFFEQRMILAGNKTYPTTVWGSMSGEILDFALGTDDNDAFALPLACADTPIRSVAATDAIYVFTATKEIGIATNNEKPLTPTNFQIKERTHQGASFMPPVRTGSNLIFSSVSRNRLYSLIFSLTENKYFARDVTIYGEHLVAEGGGIAQAVFTREPHPVLWCLTLSGLLITLTYDSDQQVEAWARHTTDGTVTNIAAVPNDQGGDDVWITVTRNGQTNVEVLDWSLQTDAAVTGFDAAGKTTWSGLDHLEGKAVVAVADGYAVQGLTVAGGQVTLPFSAKTVEIGIPFNARIKDLPVGINGSNATISQQSSVNETKVLLHNTKGCTVNGERIPFQKFDADLLDKPVQAFTGWKKVGGLGWGDSGSGNQVEIVRDLPLPCTVLAIVKEVTING